MSCPRLPQYLLLAAAFILFDLTAATKAQQTTKTNCTTNGNMTNCTSNTTDNAAQQQSAYQAGQQVGAALGQGIAAGMQAHAFSKGLKNYCDVHPGQEWHYGNRATGAISSSGVCPTQEDIAVEAANLFMSRHKDYIPDQANSQLVTAYLDSHRLNPRREDSYERAYKDLKKGKQLQLYAK